LQNLKFKRQICDTKISNVKSVIQKSPTSNKAVIRQKAFCLLSNEASFDVGDSFDVEKSQTSIENSNVKSVIQTSQTSIEAFCLLKCTQDQNSQESARYQM